MVIDILLAICFSFHCSALADFIFFNRHVSISSLLLTATQDVDRRNAKLISTERRLLLRKARQNVARIFMQLSLASTGY
jgi:hypothetical protein